MKRKKQNPKNTPVSKMDVQKAKRDATRDAIRITTAMFFTVLRDKEGYSIDDLKRVFKHTEELSDSIERGYCSMSDILYTLKKEADIEIS